MCLLCVFTLFLPNHLQLLDMALEGTVITMEEAITAASAVADGYTKTSAAEANETGDGYSDGTRSVLVYYFSLYSVVCLHSNTAYLEFNNIH